MKSNFDNFKNELKKHFDIEISVAENDCDPCKYL